MARNYTVELLYEASLTYVVNGEDEGEAYEKARQMAAEASPEEFVVDREINARITNVSP